VRTTKTSALVPLVAALVGVWSEPSLARPELTHTRLFENHDQTVYRIPALAISTEGTLLAVCNARVGSPRDDCPYIRLLLRRSTDNGKTQDAVQVLQDRKDWQAVADCNYGTAASVSFDDTKTWPLKKLISAGPSGYSASVMNKDGEFFVLYENGKHHYRDTGVSIVKFNLEWLMDGKDIKDF